MEIIWSIDNLERQPSDGLVITAHWRVSAADGDHTAGDYGSVGFQRGEDFTPFEELTQDQVIGWVKSQLDVEQIEANLANEIDALKSPKSVSGLPW